MMKEKVYAVYLRESTVGVSCIYGKWFYFLVSGNAEGWYPL